MRQKSFTSTLIILMILFLAPCQSWSGNKRLMTINAAKVLASRALVETVHGLKVKTSEEVIDLVATSFADKVESKTSSKIKGIKFEEEVYDSKKDIAKVTASITLESITNIDGQVINLGNKTYRRVAFATSTPANAGPIRALRAAELDAYKQLVKQIIGFTLESETTVENYMLKSDVVKTKVMATLYLANVTGFFWDDYGDAHVKMSLDVSEVSNILGEKIVYDGGNLVEVEGQGAAKNDFLDTQTAAPASGK
ncbi:MAG: hypothetical protein KKB30_13240 [Proteobacteria bacterium]|nr:hypothetical protein [Pseudomonadota bacterium]MBU1714983.1 hypothetical protein [Pseudomonadota bacterium]